MQDDLLDADVHGEPNQVPAIGMVQGLRAQTSERDLRGRCVLGDHDVLHGCQPWQGVEFRVRVAGLCGG